MRTSQNEFPRLLRIDERFETHGPKWPGSLPTWVWLVALLGLIAISCDIVKGDDGGFPTSKAEQLINEQDAGFPTSVDDTPAYRLEFVNPDPSSVKMASVPGRFIVTAYYNHCTADHCKRQRDAVGDGDDRVHVIHSDEPVPEFVASRLPRGYISPVFVWKNATRTEWPAVNTVATIHTLDDLNRWCTELGADREPTTETMAALPRIAGGAIVRRLLDDVTNWAGPDASLHFAWERRGGKRDLLVDQKHSRTDLLGTGGKLILDLSTKFGKTHNEFEFRVPDEAELNRVGSPLMIAWTICSAAQSIYELLHPKVSIWLPDTIEFNARMVDGVAKIDFGPSPPCVKLHWSFWMGLLKYEYSRPLTGLAIARDGITAEFHQSRIYRDVKFDFTPDPVAAIADDGTAEPRSGRWPAVRNKFRASHPDCCICGKPTEQVHHAKPFHLFPELELEESNLRAFCSACHFTIGHLWNFKNYNPDIDHHIRVLKAAKVKADAERKSRQSKTQLAP